MDYIDNDGPQPNLLFYFESGSKRVPISEWFVLSQCFHLKPWTGAFHRLLL